MFARINSNDFYHMKKDNIKGATKCCFVILRLLFLMKYEASNGYPGDEKRVSYQIFWHTMLLLILKWGQVWLVCKLHWTLVVLVVQNYS